MQIKAILIKLHQLLSSQFGIDPRVFLRSIRSGPAYLRDWVKFRSGFGGSVRFMPCLHDRYAEGGVANSEYFWQDLLVARLIYAASPSKHVDIGSRVDGFVAHVASFRQIEVFDVRPIKARIPGVAFTQADMMDGDSIEPLIAGKEGYCDSLSSLHVLEHFGLGRYGDPIDPNGYRKGLENMAMLLRPGGVLYLSTPIGQERVEFNANWVFDPRTIIATAQECSLTLKGLTVVSTDKGPKESAIDQSALQKLAEQPYNLGIFTFNKASSP